MFLLKLKQVPFSTFSTLSRLYSTANNSTKEAFLTRSGAISFLNLNRPNARNALSQIMLNELRTLIEEIRFDGTTRVVILQSTTPSMFCAGADLKQRKTMTPIQTTKFLYTLRQMLGELSGLQVPSIAAIDGAALGGGLELALACDLRVAGAAATKIGLPETRLAIIPGAGGTQRLSRLLGVSRAKDLILTAKIMSASQAVEIGLVNYLADEGQTASERAVILAKEILPAGPLAIRAAKLAIDRGSQLDLEAGLDLEQTCYQTIIPSSDRLEGLKAFAEKRKPVYIGE